MISEAILIPKIYARSHKIASNFFKFSGEASLRRSRLRHSVRGFTPLPDPPFQNSWICPWFPLSLQSIISNQMRPRRLRGAWFSRLLRHPARRRSGSILSPGTTRGWTGCLVLHSFVIQDVSAICYSIFAPSLAHRHECAVLL